MTGRGPDPSELGDILSRHSSERECVELCPICRAADILRRTNTTDDLKDGWQDVQREALLTMKAVIDRAVERLDSEPDERGPKIEDIPID
ncbi:MAG: hypothetical protein M3355_10455 [Actinomycetota bacterium]|nr:hypothetical protein [Actinomycetota bacterium]